MKLAITVLLIILGVGSPWPEARAQKLIIQMGEDGSLIIQPEKKSTPALPSGADSLAAVVIPQGKIFVLRPSGKKWSDKLPVAITTRPKPPVESNASPRPVAMSNEAFLDIVAKYASQHGIDARLVHLVIKHESGFDPQAVSPKGARGLMQLMPGTAAMLGVADPFDVEQNIAGGVKYLKECLNRFNNNITLALAAYNAGPENVSRHQGVPPFAETRSYVTNIMREYTGQAPVLVAAHPDAAPQASPSTLPPAAGTNTNGLPLRPLACLPPLYVGGPGQVNLTQIGKVKIITINNEDEFL